MLHGIGLNRLADVARAAGSADHCLDPDCLPQGARAFDAGSSCQLQRKVKNFFEELNDGHSVPCGSRSPILRLMLP